jgi:hypothetical protein
MITIMETEVLEIRCAQLVSTEGRLFKGTLRSVSRTGAFTVEVPCHLGKASVEFECPHCKDHITVRLSMRGTWDELRIRKYRRACRKLVIGLVGLCVVALYVTLAAFGFETLRTEVDMVGFVLNFLFCLAIFAAGFGLLDGTEIFPCFFSDLIDVSDQRYVDKFRGTHSARCVRKYLNVERS